MATQMKVEQSINGSGLDPADQRVLVLPDIVPEKTGGGVWIPEVEREKQKYAMQTATIVAIAPLAWAEAKYDCKRFGIEARWFAVGDRVRIGKYVGQTFEGTDKRSYVMLNDDDVLGHLID